jgi:hypothetical protein
MNNVAPVAAPVAPATITLKDEEVVGSVILQKFNAFTEAVSSVARHKALGLASEVDAVTFASQVAPFVFNGGKEKVPGKVSTYTLAKNILVNDQDLYRLLISKCTQKDAATRVINNVSDNIIRALRNAGHMECFAEGSKEWEKAAFAKAKLTNQTLESLGVEVEPKETDTHNRLANFSILDMMRAIASRAGAEVVKLKGEEHAEYLLLLQQEYNRAQTKGVTIPRRTK